MSVKIKEFIKPFRIGDVVSVSGRSWPGGEHIVYEVNIYGVNDYKYSTNRCAWIPHNNCTLIRECDEKSIKQLLTSSYE